jgi:integrase
VKASTLAMDKSRIERHVKPLIGKRTVISLTPADVAKLQTDIIAGKTATERGEGRGGVTTGGKGVASRTVGMLGTILEFARKRKVVKENVARGVERPPEGKQRRFLKPAEMKALGAAMREAANDGDNEVAHAAIRFLLLSGCRRMEVLSLPVDWLDPEGGCIRFGDTKSGAQIRPIGASAFAAIADTPRRNGWVFPAARGKGHFVGLPKVLARLCEKAKLEDVTVHVLRHSFAATAAEMGYSELTIAGLLGHSVSGVTARYAHVPDNALVSAANRVSARIAAALNGETGKGKVVQMARARR